jgi:hypothetical protein
MRDQELPVMDELGGKLLAAFERAEQIEAAVGTGELDPTKPLRRGPRPRRRRMVVAVVLVAIAALIAVPAFLRIDGR